MECREIQDFPGYWIYEDGRVWSSSRSIFIKGYVDQYKRYVLYKNGKAFGRLAHRLVLEAFVGSCPDGMECRHLDGNPQNNHVSNLKWGTHVVNEQDKKIHGTDNSGEKHYGSKLCEDDVKSIRLMIGNYTQSEIADLFGVSQQLISKLSRNKVWR